MRAVSSEPFLIEAPASKLPADANFQIVFDVAYAPFISWGSSTNYYFVATVGSLTDYSAIPTSSWRYMKA